MYHLISSLSQPHKPLLPFFTDIEKCSDKVAYMSSEREHQEDRDIKILLTPPSRHPVPLR